MYYTGTKPRISSQEYVHQWFIQSESEENLKTLNDASKSKGSKILKMIRFGSLWQTHVTLPTHNPSFGHTSASIQIYGTNIRFFVTGSDNKTPAESSIEREEVNEELIETVALITKATHILIIGSPRSSSRTDITYYHQVGSARSAREWSKPILDNSQFYHSFHLSIDQDLNWTLRSEDCLVRLNFVLRWSSTQIVGNLTVFSASNSCSTLSATLGAFCHVLSIHRLLTEQTRTTMLTFFLEKWAKPIDWKADLFDNKLMD